MLAVTMHPLNWSKLFILYLCFCKISFASANEIESKTFTKLQSSNTSVVAAGSFGTTSVLHCCTLCVSQHQSDFFTYSKDLNSCTCGSALTPAVSSSSSDELYASNVDCDIQSGFGIYVLADGTMLCLRFSSNFKDYAQAEVDCAVFSNGLLFVADTTEKLQVLQTVTGVLGILTPLWVGMDDRVTENQFVWADGRGVTQAERDALFATTEPNNFLGEDCVSWTVLGLSDQSCDLTHRHVCQTLMST